MNTATLKPPAAEPEKRGRKASKETRRQQLIEATIDSLARRGYSETTMADVADGAGLSRGRPSTSASGGSTCARGKPAMNDLSEVKVSRN